jgi:hypothetical protein
VLCQPYLIYQYLVNLISWVLTRASNQNAGQGSASNIQRIEARVTSTLVTPGSSLGALSDGLATGWDEEWVVIDNEQVYLSNLALDKSGVQSIDFGSTPVQDRCQDHDSPEMNFDPELARKWFAKCLLEHESCRMCMQRMGCPKRLLYIGDPETPDLKPILTDQQPPMPYATYALCHFESSLASATESLHNLNPGHIG